MFDGSATFEVCLDTIPTTDLFDTFTKTLCVGYDNVPLIFDFMVGRLGTVSAPIIDLSGRPVESFLHLVQSPQRSVLSKGPNFAVSPRQPPNLEYITAIEAACTKLSQEDAEELRPDINRVLMSSHPQT